MSVSHGMANSFAPLIARAVVGATFLWAGLAKFKGHDLVQGEDAARLANIGAFALATQAPASPPTQPVREGAPAPGVEPAPPAKSPDQRAARSIPSWALMQTTPDLSAPAKLYTAGDFPNPVAIRRMHTDITLRLLKASDSVPASTPEGEAHGAFWPAWASGERAPHIAWGVVIADIGGGACLMLGLLTRLWALLLSAHVATGIWLVVIGPAIQSGQGTLGFLPNHDPWDSAYWAFPLWQAALLAMSLGLFLTGPGALSLDRPLLGSPRKPTPPRTT